MVDKLYNSNAVELLAVGTFITSIGLACLFGFKGCKYEEIEKYKADKQVEVQRLQTIEELTKQYGHRIEPNDLSKFLDENLKK